MTEITIQVPVLNRPQNAEKVCASIFANTVTEVQVIFLCTPGDTAEIQACNATGERTVVTEWPAGNGDFARKHNYAFSLHDAPLILLAADDLEFEAGWDTAALAVAQRDGRGVIGTNDDANPLVKRGRHATHPIVTRNYIDTIGATFHDGLGVIYHEGYAHQYPDTELVAAAIERNEWSFSHRSVVRHLHPLFPHRGRPRTQMDDTYRKALGDASTDRQIFVRRLEQFSHSRHRSAL